MRDEDELRRWFERSDETLPEAPFTKAVMQTLRRHERRRTMQCYASVVAAAYCAWLLLPGLVSALGMLANLPLALATLGGAYWELKLLAAGGIGWLLAMQRRDPAFTQRGIARMLRWPAMATRWIR